MTGIATVNKKIQMIGHILFLLTIAKPPYKYVVVSALAYEEVKGLLCDISRIVFQKYKIKVMFQHILL